MGPNGGPAVQVTVLQIPSPRREAGFSAREGLVNRILKQPRLQLEPLVNALRDGGTQAACR